MKCFILPRGPDGDGRIRLSGEDYHYLVRVRRFAPGETFPALLPGGEETLVRVLSVDRGILTGKCAPAAAAAPAVPDLPPIILFQALPKAGKMDLIVRQAAEGAVTEIVPFAAEHSIPASGGEGAGNANRPRRWERIIREARQQSGSRTATTLRPPLDLTGLFEYWESLKTRYPKALGLLFHQTPLAQASLHGYLSSNPEIVVLTIGPEGGFSPGEVSRFLSAGFKPLTIGDTVLRTETAALYGAAAIRIILLENTSWLPNIPPLGNG
ncbi:MAG: 16S rRNA (uracil(1498)-N(3))-methyltransferase [Spirochaetaceae bacterium]|jgi:16S rRNA (uracil1498-N3)-methyltransferase|nr:16S rRNA (uracil(1498)-N(3))-methyltransferase [Spirochaetaceae bacterium]